MRLARANTGHYVVEIPFASDATIHEQGRYQLSPLSYETVRVLSGPEGNLTVSTVGVGQDRWIRLESVSSAKGDARSWPCWVDYDDLAKVASAADSPLDLSAAPHGQPPLPVVAASWGIGREITPQGSISGTTDLSLALEFLGGKALAAAGIDLQADSTVPASFSLDQRTLSGFAVQLSDLPEAIETAGGKMHSALSSLSKAAGTIDVRFSELGSSVRIQAPPASKRLAFRSAADYEAAMKACGKG